MPNAYKRIRLACDVQNPTRFINELTGVAPVAYLSDAIMFEIALFQDGALLQASDLDSVTFYLDDPTNPIADSIATFSQTLTAAQWRAGTAYSFAFAIETATMASLTAGTPQIRIRVYADDGQNSDFLLANLTIAELGTITVTPAPTPSPSYYTKVEADARYPAIADFAFAESDIDDLQALQVVHYDAQTLSGAEKTQARTNIGAAAATSTLEGFTAGALVFGDYQAWNSTLSADQTLTATGTPGAGIPYVANLIQDATGGRNVTWPSGFIVSNAAAINPKPATTTPFIIRSRRVAAGAFTSTVEPYNTTDPRCEPAFRFDLRQYNRVAQSSGITSATDTFSGLVTTFSTVKASYVASGIGTRPAAGMAGNGYYTMGATGTTAPIDATIPAGITVACVFDSRSATDARLVHLGPLGLSIDQRGGNLEFGSQSTTANRVAVAFTPNDSTATLAIFTFHAGGGASALLIKNGNAIKVNYAAGAVAGTTTTEWQLFQAQGGTARWTGRVAHVALYDRALTWEQTQALAATLCADFSINQ